MRKIIHCDADCFFAAIEIRDDPSLRHIPIAVGGSASRRGVISTCNYEARRYGIHSAMATGQALKLCPELVLIPHNMEKYRSVSRQLQSIFNDYTDVIEMVSVDEAYLDVTGTDKCRGSATLIAEEIRKRVRKEIGITVSAGVATNKFLAKIASEWRKPDGLFVIRPEEEAAFTDNLHVKHIHGVGKVTAMKLTRLGIITCRDLRKKTVVDLVEHFGAFGIRLAELSRGIDNRPVITHRIRKSLSVEHTFKTDLTSLESCQAQIPWLYCQLMERLHKLPSIYRIHKSQVKLKFSNFSQTTLERPCVTPNTGLYTDLISNGMSRHVMPVRLLGIGIQFEPEDRAMSGEQLQLFHNRDHGTAGFRSLAQ